MTDVELVPVPGAPEFFFDASCASCKSALVRSYIRPGAVSFVPLNPGEQAVRFGDATGAEAMGRLWRFSKLWYLRAVGRTIVHITPVRWVAERVYARHARNRSCLNSCAVGSDPNGGK
mgnify:FL=1